MTKRESLNDFQTVTCAANAAHQIAAKVIEIIAFRALNWNRFMGVIQINPARKIRTML